MDPTQHLERLYRHLWWADGAVLESLRGLTEPPPEAVELFAHVLGAEIVWIDRLEGVPQSVPVWPEVGWEGLERLAERSRRRYEVLLADLESAHLGRKIAYTNSAGREFVSRLDDILLHVALHGTYHRGQIARVLRRAGLDPAPTDFIAFVRGAAAARRTDSREGPA